MIIEFIGTPGAGKTTLTPTVVDVLRERGVCARSVVQAARPYAERTRLGRLAVRLAPDALRPPLLWQVFLCCSLLARLRFFARHRRLVGQVLRSQRRRPAAANARGRRVLHWFFHLAGRYEFLAARVRPDEALVLDEGFVHRVVQLFASDVETPDAAHLRSYVDLLPRPDLLVVPQAPPEICRQRVGSRGVWGHFRHKSPAEIDRYIANADLVVGMTVDYIKHKGWAVLEVDNGSDGRAAAAELRAKLSGAPLPRRLEHV